MKYFLHTVVLLLAVVFLGCGAQKRIYTKGFYTSKQQAVKKHEAADTTTSVAVSLNNIKQTKKENHVPLFAQLSKTPLLSIKKPLLTIACDTIFLYDGTVRVVHVIKSKPKSIEYYPCYASMPTALSIKRNNISRIHYADGTKETKYEKKHNYSNSSALNLSIAGLSLTLLGYLLCSLFLLDLFSPTGVVVLLSFAGAFFLAGFVLSLIGIIRGKHSDKRGLVNALAITDFVLSIPPVVALILFAIIYLFVIALAGI